MQAAVVLVALSLAYTIYLARSGLSRRVLLDRIRLRGLVGRKQARLGAISVALNWVFFLAMLALIISGGLLYFGIYAGYDTAMVHWCATWVMLGFAGLHILTHYRIGGTSQLLRILRPERLPVPPPRLDAVELLTLLVEQSARLAPEAEHAGKMPAPEPYLPANSGIRKSRATTSRTSRGMPPQPHPHHSAAQQRFQMAARARQAKPRNPTLQSNPLGRGGGDRDHRHVGAGGRRLAFRRPSRNPSHRLPPTRRRSTATPPTGCGEASSRSR